MEHNKNNTNCGRHVRRRKVIYDV